MPLFVPSANLAAWGIKPAFKLELPRKRLEAKARAKRQHVEAMAENGVEPQHRQFSFRNVPPRTLARWARSTGHFVPEEQWLATKAREQKLKRQTFQIVDRLKAVFDQTGGLMGADLYRRDGNTLHFIDPVEDKAEELQKVKHQVFLPAVAAMERRQLVNQFAKWLQQNRHTRYYVLTTGQHCSLAELPERFRRAHRKITELRRHENFKPGGIWDSVDFVLRCDEFTIDRGFRRTEPQPFIKPDGSHGVHPVGSIRPDARGSLWFHPHINLAVHFGKRLCKCPAWQDLGHREDCGFKAFKAFCDAHFGARFEDNDEIRDPREFVKYITKFESSSQLEGIGLLDVKPEELACIYEARRGMKPVQTMGSLRDFRFMLETTKSKVVSEFDGQKWNLEIVPRTPSAPRSEPDKTKPLPVNELVTVTDPSPRFGQTLRPQILVRNFNGDFKALRAHAGLSPLREWVARIESERHERAGLAAAHGGGSCVHTSTGTVEDSLPVGAVESAGATDWGPEGWDSGGRT